MKLLVHQEVTYIAIRESRELIDRFRETVENKRWS